MNTYFILAQFETKDIISKIDAEIFLIECIKNLGTVPKVSLLEIKREDEEE